MQSSHSEFRLYRSNTRIEQDSEREQYIDKERI